MGGAQVAPRSHNVHSRFDPPPDPLPAKEGELVARFARALLRPRRSWRIEKVSDSQGQAQPGVTAHPDVIAARLGCAAAHADAAPIDAVQDRCFKGAKKEAGAAVPGGPRASSVLAVPGQMVRLGESRLMLLLLPGTPAVLTADRARALRQVCVEVRGAEQFRCVLLLSASAWLKPPLSPRKLVSGEG
jgi:hypothetical protein